MTKVAQLHDGTTLEFDDEMPDDQMDAAVRQHLGLPDPIHPDIQAQGMMAATQAVTQLTQIIGDMAMSLRAMAEQQHGIAQILQSLPDALASAGQESAAMLARVCSDMQSSTAAVLGEHSVQMSGLARAISDSNNKLAQTNREVAAAIKAPKAFTYDDKGNITGAIPKTGLSDNYAS